MAVAHCRCDHCQQERLVPVYEVADSKRGMAVYVCRNCGLVQSLSSGAGGSPRVVSTSSGADWGNVRHGKGLRLGQALKVLEPLVRWDHIGKALDIGSNRGDFVKWLWESHPEIKIHAVEPDGSLVAPYQSLSSVTLSIGRFETVPISTGSIDFVYCCHTLEHADSAATMLGRIHGCMSDSGLVFVDVPNIDAISERDVVEEFFIDKHTFHFSRPIFCRMLQSAGFHILWGEDGKDLHNITVVAVKKPQGGSNCTSPSGEEIYEYYAAAIEAYANRLQENRRKLREVGAKLNEFMQRQKVAFWGAGRLFDALVKFGGLDANRASAVIDTYLAPILPRIHGVEVHTPEHLKWSPPDVVVILARSSAEEISRAVLRFQIRHIIRFKDLL